MRTAPALALLLLAAACASNPPERSAGTAAGASGTASPKAPTAASRSALAASNPAASANADAGAPSGRTVYFDFDSSEIKSEYAPLVQSHSRYLASNKATRIRIEGNTDERGSREYNLALGERRAQAVKRAMTVLGVPAARIETVSYGEERPAANGHDEASWSKNRRDDLIYAR